MIIEIRYDGKGPFGYHIRPIRTTIDEHFVTKLHTGLWIVTGGSSTGNTRTWTTSIHARKVRMYSPDPRENPSPLPIASYRWTVLRQVEAVGSCGRLVVNSDVLVLQDVRLRPSPAIRYCRPVAAL